MLLAAGIALATPGSAQAATPPTPQVVADVNVVNLGGTVHLSGVGWDLGAGDVVRVVVCGNNELDGSLDCDNANTVDIAIQSDGVFGGPFTIFEAPPSPCPCLIKVSTPRMAGGVHVPVTIVGVATAPPHARFKSAPPIRVDNVHIRGWGPWPAWFGGSPRRTLVYRVTNTRSYALHNTPVDIELGSGGDPTDFVQAPDLGTLEAGQSRTYTARLSLPPLAMGRYRAVVRVDPTGQAGTGRAATSAEPWGLFLIGLAGAGALGIAAIRKLGVRWSSRRQRLRDSAGPGWYRDPVGSGLRLWDGQGWTGLVMASTERAEIQPPEPGWYDDPLIDGQLRLWDGTKWCDDAFSSSDASLMGAG